MVHGLVPHKLLSPGFPATIKEQSDEPGVGDRGLLGEQIPQLLLTHGQRGVSAKRPKALCEPRRHEPVGRQPLAVLISPRDPFNFGNDRYPGMSVHQALEPGRSGPGASDDEDDRVHLLITSKWTAMFS